eukprot:COSAG04_NODE_566_length_12556_cov_6.540018_2_plen_167_part_00
MPAKSLLTGVRRADAGLWERCYQRDGFHPKALGSFLAAAHLAAVILGHRWGAQPVRTLHLSRHSSYRANTYPSRAHATTLLHFPHHSQPPSPRALSAEGWTNAQAGGGQLIKLPRQWPAAISPYIRAADPARGLPEAAQPAPAPADMALVVELGGPGQKSGVRCVV